MLNAKNKSAEIQSPSKELSESKISQLIEK